MNVEQELRLTSDEMLRRLDRLRELELEKRALAPGTDRFVAIAKEVERLAASVLVKTTEQERLAEASAVVHGATGALAAPIDEVAPRREISQILNEWRDAERQLAAATPGTAEHEAARASIDRLRLEYRDAYQSASRNGDNRSA